MNEKQEKYLIIAKEHALSKNGLCLSNEYINAKTKLEWKCSNPNHPSWFTTYDSVINHHTWCPKCGHEKVGANNKNNDGLLIAQNHATNKGGKCLSDKYENSKQKLIWKCANTNHKTWEASYESVIGLDTWCPECVGRFSKIEGLNFAKKHAMSKEGQCLSNEYINNHTKLIWKCSNPSHPSWEANYSNVVKHNGWCQECAKEKRRKK